MFGGFTELGAAAGDARASWPLKGMGDSAVNEIIWGNAILCHPWLRQ